MNEKSRDKLCLADRYITSGEAAEYLGVTTRTIRAMVADGRIRAYALSSRMVRYRLDEIDAAMKAGRVTY